MSRLTRRQSGHYPCADGVVDEDVQSPQSFYARRHCAGARPWVLHVFDQVFEVVASWRCGPARSHDSNTLSQQFVGDCKSDTPAHSRNQGDATGQVQVHDQSPITQSRGK